MALNTLFSLSRILRPGYYGFPGKSVVGRVKVAEKIDMSRWEWSSTSRLLDTLKQLDIVYDYSMNNYKKAEDNQLYYKITLWESIDVNP